jgi:hypothetical protein
MRGVAPEASAQRACACTEQRAGAGGRRCTPRRVGSPDPELKHAAWAPPTRRLNRPARSSQLSGLGVIRRRIGPSCGGVAPEASAQRACERSNERGRGAAGSPDPELKARQPGVVNYAKLTRADDTTAGWVIVEEAGGQFTDFTGASTAGGGSGISCNAGPIHAELLALLG